MPTLHRLRVFRDDIVFLIYLYQRWIYKVDDNRLEVGAEFTDINLEEIRKEMEESEQNEPNGEDESDSSDTTDENDSNDANDSNASNNSDSSDDSLPPEKPLINKKND
mgnify:CR=1 FL=1